MLNIYLISNFMADVTVLHVLMVSRSAQCHLNLCHNAYCLYDQCHFAQCHYPQYHNAELKFAGSLKYNLHYGKYNSDDCS
jgi:hypothetical protein